MIIPNIGRICDDPRDAIRCNRIAMRMATIEESMTGANLIRTLQECEADPQYLTPEEERKRKEKAEQVEKALYKTNEYHLYQLIIAIVDDLGRITIMIEDVTTVDVKLLLRQWYYDLKNAMCDHPDAIAYHLKK
jgi:hypothetical protein